MDPYETRCAQDEHPLTITPSLQEPAMVVIEAPECTVDCLCCQRAGSLGHTVASLFKPGVASAHGAA